MAQSSSPVDLAPRHVKAARALLAWSQQDLAKAAKVATSTVADFERGQRTPVANNAEAIRTALESAGIRFLPTGAVIGPAVPVVTQSDRAGVPVRWVSAEDLSDWANRTDGAVSLPTLLAFLVRATHGTAVRLRFPADEGVRHPGWDGQTDANEASEYVPKGVTGWEISAQRSGIPEKAAKDYGKRTKEPTPIEPPTATYIFVTPRHWPDKGKWAKARVADGPWRDVTRLRRRRLGSLDRADSGGRPLAGDPTGKATVRDSGTGRSVGRMVARHAVAADRRLSAERPRRGRRRGAALASWRAVNSVASGHHHRRSRRFLSRRTERAARRRGQGVSRPDAWWGPQPQRRARWPTRQRP